MHRRFVFLSLSILSQAVFAPWIALSQTPKRTPIPTEPIHAVELSITSVTPADPVAGQKITVNYSAAMIGVPTAAVTGTVAGNFQGMPLQQPNGGAAPMVTVAPRSVVSGSLVIVAPKAGQGTVTIGLYPPPPSGCSGGLHVIILRCRTTPIATATTSLTVVPPTVTVRISGATFSHIAEPDKNDNATANNGYLCVVHNPGCGWWGNDGKDTYFVQKQLPAGAKLVGIDFVQYWPLGVDSASGSGAWTWFDSSGSYFAHLNQDVPTQPYVKWNNTCTEGFANKDLWYSISFRVQMPEGTNLGEATSDLGTPSPCLPPGYSITAVSISPGSNPPPSPYLPSGWAGQVVFCNVSTVAVTQYLHVRATLVTSYPGAQGSAGPMVVDNLSLRFPPGGVSGSLGGFTIPQNYQQGTWKLTDVYLTDAPTAPGASAPKNAVHFPGLPFTASLPGPATSPVFNFTGGSCPAL